MSDGELRSDARRDWGRRRQSGRLWRLVLKELREILRDRRTIITLVVMPLLIYPLLALVFQRFLLTSLSVTENVEYVIGVDSPIDQQLLERQLRIGESAIDKDRGQSGAGAAASPAGKGARPAVAEPNIVAVQDENLERFVADSTLHLAAVHRRHQVDQDKPGLRTPLVWELIYRAGSPTSEAALHFVESRLQRCNELELNYELQKLGVVAGLPAAMERKPISFAGAPAFSLAALIPLILVLMTVTGAVYPAIDLTAGERERGTLETLIAAPVPRLGLLLAKYVAVLVVALLTAVVNLTGMTITAHSTGLAASLFGASMTFGIVVKVLLLLALFAAFFSAILLTLTSYARSFKEAQAYIIPLMLLCLVPGVLCLIPSLEFKGWMAVTPLVNIVMLARDLLEGSVQTSLAIAAICSTVLYIGAAIALAARIFGTDAILYGSPATWSDLMRRPTEPRQAASMAAAMLCLALMFPAYFVLANTVARAPELSMSHQFVVRALITAVVFGGVPVAIALFGHVAWPTGLGLRRAGPLTIVAAAILGISVWPGSHELALLCEQYGLLTVNPEIVKKIDTIVEQFRSMPLWLILATFALVPALFEELCFRGFLFGAFRQRLSGTATVLATALLFGCFHEVLFPGKLVPTTVLGLVLGWVRLRTASIVPGIVMHAVLDGFVLTIIYYRDELIAHGWGVEEESHLPMSWQAIALVGIVLGVGLLIATSRGSAEAASESLSSDLAANRCS